MINSPSNTRRRARIGVAAAVAVAAASLGAVPTQASSQLSGDVLFYDTSGGQVWEASPTPCSPTSPPIPG